jgi:hypothetical protein
MQGGVSRTKINIYSVVSVLIHNDIKQIRPIVN